MSAVSKSFEKRTGLAPQHFYNAWDACFKRRKRTSLLAYNIVRHLQFLMNEI
jgi:hypothetical protein